MCCSAPSEIWRTNGFLRVKFRRSSADSASFVYAKRGLRHRFAAAPLRASGTLSTRKPGPQTISSEFVAAVFSAATYK
jgi:hypothetical protein